jgi:hypothetical protein
MSNFEKSLMVIATAKLYSSFYSPRTFSEEIKQRNRTANEAFCQSLASDNSLGPGY